MAKKKSFALGYSYILHSLLSYLLYAATAVTGLNIIVPMFSSIHGVNQGDVLSANTVGAFLSAFAVLLLGKLILVKGIRFTTTVSAIATGILGFGLLGLVKTIAGYTICTIFIQGLVYGYSWTASNALITNWWPRKKGVVLGISTSGIMLASLTLVQWMSVIGAKHGFQTMVWSVGGIMVLFGIASWFWIRERPEDVGLHPDNKPLTEEEKKDAYFKAESLKESQTQWTIKEILSNKYSWALMVSFGILIMFASGVGSTVVPFAIETGYTQPQAMVILSVTSVVSILGSLITGALDTKYGPKLTSILSGVWITIAFFSLLVLPGKTGLWVCLVMAMMTMGAVANLVASLIASCFGRANFTQLFRVIYTGIYIIRSCVFLILGQGTNILGSYRSVYILFGVLSAIATVVLIGINDKTVQQPKRSIPKAASSASS